MQAQLVCPARRQATVQGLTCAQCGCDLALPRIFVDASDRAHIPSNGVGSLYMFGTCVNVTWSAAGECSRSLRQLGAHPFNHDRVGDKQAASRPSARPKTPLGPQMASSSAQCRAKCARTPVGCIIGNLSECRSHRDAGLAPRR